MGEPHLNQGLADNKQGYKQKWSSNSNFENLLTHLRGRKSVILNCKESVSL